METKYIYTIHNSSDKFDYNSNTNKFEIKAMVFNNDNILVFNKKKTIFS